MKKVLAKMVPMKLIKDQKSGLRRRRMTIS
jgi:hypothetical protein